MNLDYKICKRLKEAGFPQGSGKGYYYDEEGNLAEQVIEFDRGKLRGVLFIYAPTLSELIEECGENLCCIERASNGWLAYKDYSRTISEYYLVGKTPEEAVAKLWLELNQ